MKIKIFSRHPCTQELNGMCTEVCRNNTRVFNVYGSEEEVFAYRIIDWTRLQPRKFRINSMISYEQNHIGQRQYSRRVLLPAPCNVRSCVRKGLHRVWWESDVISNTMAKAGESFRGKKIRGFLCKHFHIKSQRNEVEMFIKSTQ